jgi:hypothetical protein
MAAITGLLINVNIKREHTRRFWTSASGQSGQASRNRLEALKGNGKVSTAFGSMLSGGFVLGGARAAQGQWKLWITIERANEFDWKRQLKKRAHPLPELQMAAA